MHRRHSIDRGKNLSTTISAPSLGIHGPAIFRNAHGHEALIRRLALETVWEGHRGCVNRLSWNSTGSLLASGSDDTTVWLWGYDTRRAKMHFATGHSANIFGVKFLPGTDDRQLVTGAMDGEVRHHTLIPTGTGATSTAFYCHSNRVKAVEVDPLSSFIFWSASEDGTVRQFDLREPHSAQCGSATATETECHNVLIDLRTPPSTMEGEAQRALRWRRGIEVLGISLNSVRTEYIALATRDPYVRIFDRRKLTVGGRRSTPTCCVSHFVPPHILRTVHNEGRHRFTTYVTFSPDGTEVLANYSGDHAYCFSFLGGCAQGVAAQFDMSGAATRPRPAAAVYELAHLPPDIEALREAGNIAFSRKSYSAAIDAYTKAILVSGEAAPALLFTNRAAALLRRGWRGDADLALADAERALAIQPDFMKAHYRKVQALRETGQLQLALRHAEQCIAAYPTMVEVAGLAEKIRAQLQQQPNSSRKRKRSNADDNDYEEQTTTDNRRGQREDEDNEDHQEEQDEEEDEEAASQPSTTPPVTARLGLTGSVQISQFTQRYVGHCNVSTDIKEASFLGDGQFVACGSDDGRIFIYERASGTLVLLLDGDKDVVNCIQGHPYDMAIATSGIENVVRLWLPIAAEPVTTLEGANAVMQDNQQRMTEGRGFGVRMLTPALLQQLLAQSGERVECGTS